MRSLKPSEAMSCNVLEVLEVCPAAIGVESHLSLGNFEIGKNVSDVESFI